MDSVTISTWHMTTTIHSFTSIRPMKYLKNTLMGNVLDFTVKLCSHVTKFSPMYKMGCEARNEGRYTHLVIWFCVNSTVGIRSAHLQPR